MGPWIEFLHLCSTVVEIVVANLQNTLVCVGHKKKLTLATINIIYWNSSIFPPISGNCFICSQYWFIDMVQQNSGPSYGGTIYASPASALFPLVGAFSGQSNLFRKVRVCLSYVLLFRVNLFHFIFSLIWKILFQTSSAYVLICVCGNVGYAHWCLIPFDHLIIWKIDSPSF